MKSLLRIEKGMTLVELLAAIALLSIVFVTFMSIFTQAAKFTAHNHETLTAVQVAEEVVAEVRGINEITDLKKANNSITNGILTDKQNYAPYIVTIKEDPNILPGVLSLKKALISVKSAPGAGIDEPEFKTEMYFEEESP